MAASNKILESQGWGRQCKGTEHKTRVWSPYYRVSKHSIITLVTQTLPDSSSAKSLCPSSELWRLHYWGSTWESDITPLGRTQLRRTRNIIGISNHCWKTKRLGPWHIHRCAATRDTGLSFVVPIHTLHSQSHIYLCIYSHTCTLTLTQYTHTHIFIHSHACSCYHTFFTLRLTHSHTFLHTCSLSHTVRIFSYIYSQNPLILYTADFPFWCPLCSDSTLLKLTVKRHPHTYTSGVCPDVQCIYIGSHGTSHLKRGTTDLLKMVH